MPYTFKHGDRPLDGITVQRAVGRGGFGEVYYALTDSGKQIALKYLRENPEIELRGISHVMNLKSPHLITIYDVRHGTQGEPFVIMEYVSGPSLRELMLAEPHGLGPQKAAFFVDGVAKGLSYLHDRGIVHRDLKPANIFYDDGYVKIGDYGLSKHISVSKHSGQTVSVGTVHYMAPEIGSGNYSKAIDIYALGVILFELLTGNLPFTGASMGEILMRHLSDRPDLSRVPEPFASVIAKALAKDPKDRYQDASEMVDALRQFADVTASIASFDPATLTRGPRDPAALDPEKTLTTPPRVPPPPPLDVRQAAIEQGIPRHVADKLQKKADKIAQKLEQKAEQLRQRGLEFMRRRRGQSPAEQASGPDGSTEAPPHRWGQVFVLMAVCAAVAVGLAVLRGDDDMAQRAVALAACIAAGTVGPLLTYFRFLPRSPARSPMWDQLAYAGVTALLMIPAFALAVDIHGGDGFARMMLAPLAVLALCNWTKRIEDGRLGAISGGAAFWPAVIGLVAASVANAGDYQLPAACVCATMSLLTQAAAVMWPIVVPGVRGARRTEVATAVDSVGRSAGDAKAAWDSAPPAQVVADGDVLHPVQAGERAPRSAILRVFFGILSTIALATSLGCFFPLVIVQPNDLDVCSGLLFGTLAGLAVQPFLLTKALQRYKVPLWRGTMRLLVVSAALCLVAGMIAIISFGTETRTWQTADGVVHTNPLQRLDADELMGAIFGLVSGSVIALVALFACGRSWRIAAARRRVPPLPAAPAGPPPSARSDAAHHAEVTGGGPPSADVSPPPPPVVIDAAAPSFAGRAANAGLSFVGKMLLLVGIVLAVGHPALKTRVQEAISQTGTSLPRGVEEAATVSPPPGLLLGVIAFGCALLLLARRGGGWAHLLRGCLACVLILRAVFTALHAGASAWYTLLTTHDWSTVQWDMHAAPLMWTAVPLVAAVILLAWPSRRRAQTIVI